MTMVRGSYTSVQVGKTRPANTTAYSANDVVSEHATTGTVWTFSNLARQHSTSGYIVKARIITDEVTGQTQRLRLYLFNAAPTGELDDNVASTTPQYADEAQTVGIIDFDALDNTISGADSSMSQRDDLRLSVKAANTDRDIYGILVTLDAFTPVSGQQFTITLEMEHLN